MKTIKIIDLLNKIANDEYNERTVFKYDNKTYTIVTLSDIFVLNHCVLNDEVEIIEEEKKIPEKIGLIKYCEDQATSLIHNKVDEIIDYLDYLESKEKEE